MNLVTSLLYMYCTWSICVSRYIHVFCSAAQKWLACSSTLALITCYSSSSQVYCSSCFSAVVMGLGALLFLLFVLFFFLNGSELSCETLLELLPSPKISKWHAAIKNSYLGHLNSNIHVQVWLCYCAKKITSNNFDTHRFLKTELSFHRGRSRWEGKFGSPWKTWMVSHLQSRKK